MNVSHTCRAPEVQGGKGKRATALCVTLLVSLFILAHSPVFAAPESSPQWPESVRAPKGAPNVVLILLDDIGFADTSTFGGLAQTPQLDALAARGLRYNNFHTTAICSATRAALLSGRNHHRVGFGTVADYARGYPGYDSVWKKSTASIAQVLRSNGYSTAAFGKWHNTPDWEITPIGPYERWPTGLGFDFFYGFMGPKGAENQWEPTKLYRNTLPVDAPATPEQGYHLTTDLTDEAIRWIRIHQASASDRPYFVYFAPGAVHSPHHAPREWIERYRGQFDQGWDQVREQIFARQKRLGVIPAGAMLTPRPREIPAWSSLSADQKRLFARQMEVYAGFIAHTDAEVGRLLQAVRSAPEADNTLILYIVGDNGAAGNTGLDGYASGAETIQEQLQYQDDLGGAEVPINYYSSGWAWVGGTPFQYWKPIASHFGGTNAPVVISWPARIKDRGGLRSQFAHVTDVAATLYDVIGITPPSQLNGVEQQPLDGASFAQTFADAAAPSNHRVQYFEMLGNRAIYQDGWIAAARHPSGADGLPTAADRWELYHVTEDFSEANDLASLHPRKLKELQALFDREALKNDVYPMAAVIGTEVSKPSLISQKRDFSYYPGVQRVPAALLPDLARTSYRMSADVIIPADGAEGVIVSYGDRASGFVWYVKAGRVVLENRAGRRYQVLTSDRPLPVGRLELSVVFDADPGEKSENWRKASSGTGRLYVNGQLAAQAFLPKVMQPRDVAMYVGRAAGSPVSSAFAQPFPFTGVIERVSVQLR